MIVLLVATRPLALFGVFLVLVFVVVDLEIAELVGVLGRGDDAQPVAEVVLLQVLLREVLQIPLGEGNGRSEDDLVLVPGETHVAAKVLGLAAHLDPLLEVGLEVCAVHDAVLDGVRAVDGELEHGLLAADLAEAALAPERLLAGLGRLLGDGLLVARLLGLGLHLDRHHVAVTLGGLKQKTRVKSVAKTLRGAFFRHPNNERQLRNLRDENHCFHIL